MVKPRLYALCSRHIHVTWNWEVRPQRCRNQVNFEWANRLSIFSALFSTPAKSGWVIAHPAHPIPAPLGYRVAMAKQKMAAVAAAAIFQVPVFNPCWMACGAATASSSLEKKEAIHFQATIPSRPAKLLPLRLRPRLLAAAGAVVPITIWLLTSFYAPACAPGWNHSGFLFVEICTYCVYIFYSQNRFDKN